MIDVQTFNTVGEATQAVSSGGHYFGGGTLVMRSINYCEGDGADRLVRVTDPSLKEIRMEGNRLVLGAGVTMSELTQNRDTEFWQMLPARLVVLPSAVRQQLAATFLPRIPMVISPQHF